MPSANLGIDELVFGAVTRIGAGRGHVVLVGLIMMAFVAARRAPDALFVLVAVLGAPVVSRVVKNVYDAPRPPTVDQALQVPTVLPAGLVVAVLTLSVIFGPLRGWRARAFVACGIVLVVLLLQAATNRLLPITRDFDAYPAGTRQVRRPSPRRSSSSLGTTRAGDGRWPSWPWPTRSRWAYPGCISACTTRPMSSQGGRLERRG
jgi:hypothetical protein